MGASFLPHAAIGNGRILAVIAPTSAVEWLCLPRFDSPSFFGRILDEKKGGTFRLLCDGAEVVGKMEYVRNTNVLRTTFETPDAAWEIVDYAPYVPGIFRDHAPIEMVRLVTPLRGRVKLTVDFDPRPQYGLSQPCLVSLGDRVEVLGAEAPVQLLSTLPSSVIVAHQPFVLDRPLVFVLTYGVRHEGLSLAAILAERDHTIESWRSWAKSCALPPFHAEEVLRSALCLKLHQFRDTGAIIAAATTSIPEALGTERTWDYRYCWLRDAAFVVEALRRLSQLREGEAFLRFLSNVAENGPLQPVYGIAGERSMAEELLPHLAGFRGNGHVRIGNAAAEQQQNDLMGEIMLCLDTFVRDPRLVYDHVAEHWPLVEKLVEQAIRVYPEDDMGIWEFRTLRRPYSFSKAMCWTAASRGAGLAARFGHPEEQARWSAFASTAHDEILTRSYSTKKKMFTQRFDGESADATSLLLPVLGIVPATDPRFQSTLDEFEKVMLGNGLMKRYNNEDDFGVTTSAFVMCSFWWAEALALGGRLNSAIEVFERTLAHANPVGLFSEDIDPETGELLGNFPQAYTHVGLILAAMTIGSFIEVRDGLFGDLERRVSQVLLASNRLPLTVDASKGALEIHPSLGGVATGLAPLHESSGGLWFGAPPTTRKFTRRDEKTLRDYLQSHRLVPVQIDPATYHGYYDECSNSVIWPLFHYLMEQVPPVPEGWKEYVQANRAFADAIAARYQPGDSIWIQDYHLMLLPAMLREKHPKASIGFFLHIPFPSYEVFRTMPWREELLRGLLGANLIGFHTPAYLRHYSAAVQLLLGLDMRENVISMGDRAVRLGVFPMGIDWDYFDGKAREGGSLEESRRIHGGHEDELLFLGVDRLDVTKGMLRRLAAFELFLETSPELRARVKLLLIVAPSREDVKAHQALRRQLEEQVGHVNGLYGTATHAPVQYVYRAQTQEELIHLYQACDVLLVTPLRDGLNLVALEFAACRNDEDGILMLSEMAGAAALLPGALACNPYDVAHTAQTMRRAVMMHPEERRRRMESMRTYVKRHTVFEWSKSFLRSLDSPVVSTEPAPPAALEGPARAEVLKRLAEADVLRLFLDFDGTLVDFADSPDLPNLTPEAAAILESLAANPRIELHIVSGRRKEDLEARFTTLDAVLHAEHALWYRLSAADQWRRENVPVSGLSEWARPWMDFAAASTPGSLVEEKSAGLAWHYRCAQPEAGERQAMELKQHLIEILANAPVDVVQGRMVIEVRPTGVNKGLALARIRRPPVGREIRLAMGDDRTDEDMFAGLRPGDVGIHVGLPPSAASFALSGVAECLHFLKALSTPLSV